MKPLLLALCLLAAHAQAATLKGFYSLADGTSGLINQISGGFGNLTPVGAVQFNTVGGSAAAVSFTASDYIKATSTLATDLGTIHAAYSFEFDAYVISYSSPASIPWSMQSSALGCVSGGFGYSNFSIGSAGAQNWESTALALCQDQGGGTTYPTGAWHRIRISFDGTNKRRYYDSVLDAGPTAANADYGSTVTNMLLGLYGLAPNYVFNGAIRNFAVYDGSYDSTFTPTPTGTPTFTVTPSATPTWTPTYTPTPTPSWTPTATPTWTDSPTLTQTQTFTDSPTPSVTLTPSPTLTFTNTDTNTPTPSLTASPTQTQTFSATPSRTASPTTTPTLTPYCQIVGNATPESFGYTAAPMMIGNAVTLNTFARRLTFSVYVQGVTPGAQVQAMLYRGDWRPSSLAVASVVMPATAGWVDLTATVSVVNPGTYWLLFQFSTDQLHAVRATGSTVFVQNPQTTFGRPQSSAVGNTFLNRGRFSSYITVCNF